jgi:3-hydroxyisobutyrate dehydrogenase-like beta-hydroxyacid dehydrogenase
LGVGSVHDVDKLVLPQVRHTIEQLHLLPADSAAATLAERYAELIDHAAVATTYLKPLRELRAVIAGNTAAAEHLTRLEVALSAHSVASDLGPKLLAVLESLGATPKARGAVMGGGGSAAQGALARIRAARPG